MFYVLKKPIIVMIQQSLDSQGFFVLSFGTKSAEDMKRNGVLPGPVNNFLGFCWCTLSAFSHVSPITKINVPVSGLNATGLPLMRIRADEQSSS